MNVYRGALLPSLRPLRGYSVSAVANGLCQAVSFIHATAIALMRGPPGVQMLGTRPAGRRDEEDKGGGRRGDGGVWGAACLGAMFGWWWGGEWLGRGIVRDGDGKEKVRGGTEKRWKN